MPSPVIGKVYEFGPFRYDSAQRALFRDGNPVPLEPKLSDTLHVLLERRGQIVEKAELIKLVWPDCSVEEIGLARNISLLRKTLGDDAETYIQTVPKRGYRFAAGVEQAPASVGRRRTWPAAAASIVVLAGLVYWQFYRPSRYVPGGGLASLAVMPPECLTPELEHDGFAQGFGETLAAEISKLKSVQVISPSTVGRYRKARIPIAIMARLLGLHVVVEGTAQKLGPRLRLNVRLTDVHSGKLIWADGYDLDTQDLDRSEAETARAIAAQIGRRLSP